MPYIVDSIMKENKACSVTAQEILEAAERGRENKEFYMDIDIQAFKEAFAELLVALESCSEDD